MADDGKVTIRMLLDDAGYKKSLSDAKTRTTSALSHITTAGTSAFKSIQSVGSAAFKGIVAGAGVAAAGIGVIMKKSITDFAEYEQLVGGVETLFKKSSDRVMAYANDAYKTAGLSANEYMSTVTSFSASLLQGLGGDTEKAAKKANQAITDMSDNANKMGTDMAMVQNAYQGFAKQNYMMLDNLKLGYGGTAGEMARLVNESGVLGKKLKVNAETVKEVSFDKLIDAIHVVQTRLGITGTTAKEASTTIQGSLNAMKSAWQNFTTGLSDPSQEISKLAENLVDSIITVGKNIVPRIKALSPGISKGFGDLIKSVIPEIVPIAKDTIKNLNFGEIAPEIGNMLAMAVQSGLEIAPGLVTVGVDTFSGLFDEIDADALAGSAEKLIDNFFDSLDKLSPKLATFAEKAVGVIAKGFVRYEGSVLTIGMDLIMAMVRGVDKNKDMLIQTISNTIKSLISKAKTYVPELINLAKDIVKAITKEIGNSIPLLKPVTRALEYLINNLDKVAGIAIIAATAFKTYSAAMAIASIINKAKVATEGLTAAQVILNGVMAANPIGLVVTAVAALSGVAYLAYKDLTKLSDGTRELKTATDEHSQALRDQTDAYNDQIEAIDERAEKEILLVENTERLYGELQTLATETGKVTDKDKERVQFILNELNTAYDTEYSLVGNQITRYQDLQKEIDKLIQKKKAQILLDAAEEKYRIALENQQGALESERQFTYDVTLNKANVDALQKELDDMLEKIQKRIDSGGEGMTFKESWIVIRLQNQIKDAKSVLDTAKKDLADARNNAKAVNDEITRYETASALIIQGKTAEAIDYLQQEATASANKTAGVMEDIEKEKEARAQAYADALVDLDNYIAKFGESEDKRHKDEIERLKGQVEETREAAVDIGIAINDGIIDGLSDGEQEKKLNATIRAMLNNLDGKFGINVKVSVEGNNYTEDTFKRRQSNMQGHATGLSRVPYDNYPAILHEDEKILTKPQANQYDQIVTLSLGAIAQFSRLSSMNVGVNRSQQSNAEVAAAINRMSNAINRQNTGAQTLTANLMLDKTELGKTVFKLNRAQSQRVGTQVIGVQTYDL